ncbi:MAG TPA: hypothetical protein VH590_05665 [Ktedonobacterales bacterium]
MIRQFCRNIARVFGGQGGIRNLAVIFIIVAGLLLSCCFVLVAVAGVTPGGLAQTTPTPTTFANGSTPTPTQPINTPTPTPVTSTPTPTPTAATQPSPTPTPTSATQPTPTPTTPPPTPTPTTPSSGVTPTLPPCNGTPTGSVPCKGPGTGGGPGSGPQSGVENGGMPALVLVALLSLVVVAGGVTAALRVRRARGR